MKILYDHQMFSLQKYGGITKYFCELIKHTPAGNEYLLSLRFSYNQHLKEDKKFFKKPIIPMPDVPFKGKGFIQNKMYFINQSYSKRRIDANEYDLLHPTYYDNYFLKGLKKPYIITVHDLLAFKFKSSLYKDTKRKPQMERVIKNANRIIAISENTKNDIVDILKIDPAKIDVVYHGYNKDLANNRLNPYSNYILFVGNREGYKNFSTFIKAIGHLFSKESALKLICVGDPFTREEIADLKSLNILKQSLALNVNENSLNDIYRNALVLVYPSLYEGFGMPVLEAFANNCPACISNTSALPEIAADAACYFDPYDKESILAAIEKVIYDDAFSKKLIESGKKRLADFSWEKTAEETMNSYKKTVETTLSCL